MEYTNEQLNRELDQAFKLLKDKHNIDISEEELLSQNAALPSDEKNKILAMLMSVAESEKKEKKDKRKIEKTTITVEVLKETAERFNAIYEKIGVTVGEQIDRMSFNFHPYDMGMAAELICEDILIHTVNFNHVQFNFVIYLVLSMLKKSFADNEPSALRRLVDEVGTLICGKGAEAPANSESK